MKPQSDPGGPHGTDCLEGLALKAVRALGEPAPGRIGRRFGTSVCGEGWYVLPTPQARASGGERVGVAGQLLPRAQEPLAALFVAHREEPGRRQPL